MKKLMAWALVFALLMMLSGCFSAPGISGSTPAEESTVPKPETATVTDAEDKEESTTPDVPEAEETPTPEVSATEEPTVTATPETEELTTDGAPEITEPTDLDLLREKIQAEGKLFGIAYLGGFEGDAQTAQAELFNQAYLNDLAFVKDIGHYVVLDGWQMYCVVPVDDTVSLSICEYVFADLPYAGEELLFTNEPVLLRGNVSDIVPNLCIIATKGAERVEYCPMQSGMDGTLVNSEQNIYDFTPYDTMPEFSWMADE